MAKKRMALACLTLGCLISLWSTSNALATHVRPGGGSPERDPMVPDLNECANSPTPEDPSPSTPNSTHVTPANVPSCTAVSFAKDSSGNSTFLTMGNIGQGLGFVKLIVYCANPGTGVADKTSPPATPATPKTDSPPCTPNDGVNSLDVEFQGSATDVRCAALAPGCAAINGDYTGDLIAQLPMRITDHASGSPANVCTNGSGNPPCTTATAQTLSFGIPIGCVDNGAAGGGRCNLDTSLNTLVPNFVREFQRGVVDIKTIRFWDWGPDGTTALGANPCPYVCGSGDEHRFLHQGLFLP